MAPEIWLSKPIITSYNYIVKVIDKMVYINPNK